MGNLPFLLFLLICFFQVLSCTKTIHVSGKCLNDERLNLLQVRDGLQFTSTYSNKLAHWNQSRDCCHWDGVACDNFGHVISLELDHEWVTVKNENWKSIFKLQHLERLNLAWNNFDRVKIPEELFNLTKLKYLKFSDNGFVGQIPIGLSRMKSLIILDLATHFPLYEALETKNTGLEALLHNLTELRELYLDRVNISAPGNNWCSALSSLSNLRVLSLIDCYLLGPVTYSLLRLGSLEVIRLDGNNLSTTHVDFFENFSNLTTLSLSFCNLQDQFPKKIFQVPTLENLDLSENDLIKGILPPFPKEGSLRRIVLTNTSFSGSLPKSIGNLRALSVLDLSYCNFEGPIPVAMANLTKLAYLDLLRNVLSGPISSAHFEGLVDLEYAQLGWNSLTGRIPSSLFDLPSLKQLQLSNNQFDGHIDKFPNASHSLLNVLDLRSNNLRGFIPRSFFQLGRLIVLLLSFNNFSGILELKMFEGLCHLTVLDLSYNNLSIDASSSSNTSLFSFQQVNTLKLASCNLQMFPNVQNQSRLIHLDLSLNYITGQIPNWIWKLGNLFHLNLSFNLLADIQKPYTIPSYLLVLDLHANQLRGQIPTPSLEIVYLDYSRNKFNVSIPPNIGDYMSQAYFLSLANNSITGTIPESICENASSLEVLDLSKNALSGRIPACLLEIMKSLVILNLGGNNLNGVIPDTFGDQCRLRTLNLSRNSLKGKIPRSLSNCKFLRVLNIGKNNIEDTFPCILTKESNLRVLILRSNGFQGEIGCSRYNHSWPSLQMMDIAYNNFSGALSTRHFSNWRGMMYEEDSAAQVSEYLQYGFLELSNLYYMDAVTLTIKGLEVELVKILRAYKTIDFSCNKFHGLIPETVGELKGLYILNLSQNAFTGTIPESIGNLTQLGSLDLSMNQLRGIIPLKLASLTILSFLNLSFNQLVGEIPVGPQFQTFSGTSFLGNIGLCGFPLNLSCNKPKENGLSQENPFENQSAKNEIEWEYVTAALGFTRIGSRFLAELF